MAIFRKYVAPYLGTVAVVIVTLIVLKAAKPMLPAFIANRLP